MLDNADCVISSISYIWTNTTAASDGMTGGYVYTDGKIGLGRIGINETVSAAGVIVLNRWHHVAFVRRGTAVAIFVNGVQVATPTTTNLETTTVKPMTIGGQFQSSGNSNWTGYISNFRVVKGTALYRGNFTPPTRLLEATDDTVLLACNSKYGWTNFHPVDEVGGRPSYVNRQTGDPKLSNFSPLAPVGWSAYFDGSGDYLTGPTGNSTLNTALNINAVATDFTVEFWFKLNDATNANGGTVVTNFTSLGGNGFVIGLTTAYDGSGLYFSSWVNNAQTATKSKSNGGNWDLTGWNHAAIVGNGGNLYFYANGVELGTLFDLSRAITTTGTGTGLGIGAYIQNLGYAGYFPGYISNLRIVKGTAVYTSNFTPPTAPLEPIAGTSLLTCQSSTVVDNSDNAFALTVNGNSQPTQFNPFGETVATGVEYAPASHGGSVYFDGTGDYLTSGTSTAYSLGTGDFTIEAWLYNFGFAGSQYGRGWCTLYQAGGYNTTRLMLRLNNGYNAMNMWLYLNPSVYFGGSGTNSTALITPYSWTHAAFVRQSGTFKLYINGTLDTTISGVTIGLNFDTVEIGRNQDGSVPDWNGYIDDLRITRGVARYTATFTAPTRTFTLR